MIRFCDKDVVCVTYDEIDRGELLKYFLDGNLDEIVCVIDADGNYFGHIIYNTLIRNAKMEDAILRDVLVLNKDIWKNGRLLFAVYKSEFGNNILLPVVDENQHLVCFAYEDWCADKNLRILRELQDKSDALQFADIYPDCQCVELYEFNELAYFFAKYLRSQNIRVQVRGAMWENFIVSDTGEYSAYHCMKIYAEGVWKKTSDWTDNLLRSVSAEFECIDHIYEENIKAGFITNADKSYEEFMNFLRESDEIVILGTELASQDAFDFLKKNGIEIACFVSDRYDDRHRKLFGKQVLRKLEALEQYSQAVFLDPCEEGSAWGMGRTDEFDYIGYERNKNYFLLKDYITIPKDGLKTVLKNRNIVLMGDILLCEKTAEYLDQNKLCPFTQLAYLAVPDETAGIEHSRLKIVNAEGFKQAVLCLILMPDIHTGPNTWEKSREEKRKAISYLQSHGVDDYTDYFSDMEAWTNIEGKTEYKYHIQSLRPKRTVLGSIAACSGNTLVRGALDGHPAIVMMDWGSLNNNLLWFCMQLSAKASADIPALFLQLYNMQDDRFKIHNIDLFMNKLYQLLEMRDRFTSQELFVIFHIAFVYSYGREIADINQMVIYWEPHHISREQMEDCAQWLGTKMAPCDVLNVVRNSYIRNGSYVKGLLEQNWPGRDRIGYFAVRDDDFIHKTYQNSKRHIVKFEDLKCSPKEELNKICSEWEIPWSESLMYVSIHGEERLYHNGNKVIKNFDLTPVYNTYDEYFSEFDRFKITLLCMPWQKKHGYPYSDISAFSGRELQEIFLKEFRFMERLHFDTERTKKMFHINFQNYVRKRIQKLKMITAMKRKEYEEEYK